MVINICERHETCDQNGSKCSFNCCREKTGYLISPDLILINMEDRNKALMIRRIPCKIPCTCLGSSDKLQSYQLFQPTFHFIFTGLTACRKVLICLRDLQRNSAPYCWVLIEATLSWQEWTQWTCGVCLSYKEHLKCTKLQNIHFFCCFYFLTTVPRNLPWADRTVIVSWSLMCLAPLLTPCVRVYCKQNLQRVTCKLAIAHLT